jgi:hypothetical protein
MDLAFDDMSRPRGRGQFFNFLCAPLFYNASFSGSYKVNDVYLVQVSLPFIGQQGFGHFFRNRHFLPIG